MKKIGLVIVVIIALVLGYAAVQSPDYKVTRQVTINAPAEKIFPYLNNMKKVQEWGPWLEADPTAQMSYSGSEEGVGAVTKWTGGKQMGTGSATVVESIPNQKVGVKIEYTEPMGMIQDSYYEIISAGDQSTVTWSVTGQNNFVGRIMCLFVNMDKMVGGMFEKGLTKLKGIVETAG